MLKKIKLSKKTFIIIVAAAVVLIATSVAAAFLGRSAARRDRTSEAPARYFAKSDDISSVTDILGERKFEEIGLEDKEPSAAEALESSRAETAETSEAGAAQPSAGGTEESMTESAPDAEEGDVKSYIYFPESSVSEDVSEYLEYLKTEKKFLDISQGEESEEDSGEIKVYRLAGPAHDDKSHLEITIEAGADSYTITTVTSKEAWNSWVSQLWEDEKKKEKSNKKKDDTKSSMQLAQEAVGSMEENRLNLEETVNHYDFITGPGLIRVDGKNYYRVGAYKKQENGTITYECAYLVDYESGTVDFKYNDVTGETEPLD